MRWGQLFEDLEGRWRSERARDFEAEVAERVRSERAGVELAARLAAARGATVSLVLVDGTRVHGVLADATPQWVLLHAAPGEHLVPVAAVAVVIGAPVDVTPVTEVERRLSLGAALRALARDRTWVTVRACGFEATGLLESVGADHVDVAHAEGTVVTVPFGSILEVRSASA